MQGVARALTDGSEMIGNNCTRTSAIDVGPVATSHETTTSLGEIFPQGRGRFMGCLVGDGRLRCLFGRGMGTLSRMPYLTDVAGEKQAFLVRSRTLMRERCTAMERQTGKGGKA